MAKNYLKSKAGVSMVEMSVAMAITAFTCSGLYTMGISLRRSAERMRITTEAQSFAKESIEEIISIGQESLALPSCTLRQSASVAASTGATLSRSVQILWHDAGGSVLTNYSATGYAEVHVSVDYPAPRSGKLLRNTCSTILN